MAIKIFLRETYLRVTYLSLVSLLIHLVTYLSFVFCIGAGIISNIPHATAPEWAILAFLQQHKATLAFWADMMSRAAKVATC